MFRSGAGPAGHPASSCTDGGGALVAVGWPPRTSVEQTVLDLIKRSTRADDVVGLITRACQRRLTTVKRLTDAVQAQQRMPWRALILDVLDDARGAQSPLEWRYLRFVERAHGLPHGDRQVAALNGTSRLWRDVVYEAYGVVIELDGAAAHPGSRRHRDMARDNDVIAMGGKSLRYGWHDVAGRPCEVAQQVAVVLRACRLDGCSPAVRPEMFRPWTVLVAIALIPSTLTRRTGGGVLVASAWSAKTGRGRR